MTDGELEASISAQKQLMIAVATGGPRIDSVNAEYIERRGLIAGALADRHLRDPNPFDDLWKSYGKWSAGDLPNYRSRREYIGEMYAPLSMHLRQHVPPAPHCGPPNLQDGRA
jgi:hypothetical protein